MRPYKISICPAGYVVYEYNIKANDILDAINKALSMHNNRDGLVQANTGHVLSVQEWSKS